MRVGDLLACINREMLIIPVVDLTLSDFGDTFAEPKPIDADDDGSASNDDENDDETNQEALTNASFTCSGPKLSATIALPTSRLKQATLVVFEQVEAVATAIAFVRTGHRAATTTRFKTKSRVRMICSLRVVVAVDNEKPKQPGRKGSKMAADVVESEEFCFTTTSIDRPFRLVVQKSTFLIDSTSMGAVSPIFSAMCFGKDFDKGMALSRDIVDEKSRDIDVFLRAVHDPSLISASNFQLVLRLSNKYQVAPLVEACENFILRQDLSVAKAEDVLTMLIAAHEFHCEKPVLVALIRRLASEGNAQFTKLKISRFLPAQVYGSVISTSMNMASLREHDAMNGHSMKMDRAKTRWRAAVCEVCRAVTECATCEQCKKAVCKKHVDQLKCSSDFGKICLEKLRDNLVDFEWTD